MALILAVITFLGFLFALPEPASAIVILPAIILIPIAKLVALIVGALSIPTLTAGTVWSRLFKKSLKRTICVLGVILLVLGFAIFLLLKLLLPNHPLV